MNFEISRDQDFLVEHCYSCAVPGYLIVTPVPEAHSLDELPLETAERLGPVLASAATSVKAVCEPIRIYCAQFGEEQSRLHFHVFPRSQALTDDYLVAFPMHASQIRGPIMLDWARDRYRCSPEETFAAVSETITRLRRSWPTQQGVPADADRLRG